MSSCLDPPPGFVCLRINLSLVCLLLLPVSLEYRQYLKGLIVKRQTRMKQKNPNITVIKKKNTLKIPFLNCVRFQHFQRHGACHIGRQLINGNQEDNKNQINQEMTQTLTNVQPATLVLDPEEEVH